MRGFFKVFGFLVLMGYSFVEWRGLNLQLPRQQYSPQGLRSAAHGGYRSYWSSGFHGGK
jgi:hypothetical protein